MRFARPAAFITVAVLAVVIPARAHGQQDHSQMQMAMPEPPGWQVADDGLFRLFFNHQGGPRGGDEIAAPNWWMGMATRPVRSSRLTFTGMFSFEPATDGKAGYREILQSGEALNGLPLVDRQHPHDAFMQLAAVWRIPIGERTAVTLAGGPVGEPALGPIAFMHRPSAAALPLAPLSHHTFDSTHIAFGVVTAALDRGPLTAEICAFNGREPDENRWDFDFGPLDSLSARVWYRPNGEWEFQASTGHLVHPEQLQPGDIQRTTASASWFRPVDGRFTAVAFGYGVNAADGGNRHAVFGEASRSAGRTVWSGRVELVQVETDLLLNPRAIPDAAHARRNAVAALTGALTYNVLHWRGLEAAVGAALTANVIPASLRTTYGSHPVSFQVFLQILPPTGRMGRMWNMRMARPMPGQPMTMTTGHMK